MTPSALSIFRLRFVPEGLYLVTDLGLLARVRPWHLGTRRHALQLDELDGGEGRIAIEVPFNAPPHQATRIRRTRDGRTEGISVEAADQ